MVDLYDKYVIINDTDAPQRNMVCELVEGKYYYMTRGEEKHKMKYKMPLCPVSGRSIIEFGFDIVELLYKVNFTKVRPSTATYSDGRHRDWQGATEFSLPRVIL